jgi:nucleotide-binding universal stress UspA family protein
MHTRKILVPLDGSPVSEAALPFAQALAHRTGAPLALIRAEHTQSMPAIAEAEHYLAGFAEQLANRGLAAETGVAFGSAADWIIEEISLRKANLVVMATHDRSGPDRWLHGSIAESVISRASVPVLVVRATAGTRPVERFEQPNPVLVVPLDGSELAEAALSVATQLAAELNGSLALVSVVPGPGQIVYAEGIGVPHSEAESERLHAEAETYLHAAASQIESQSVVARTVRKGDPAGEIAAEAEERGAAAIIMATHGRAGALRTLLGSIAGQVVHTSGVPVVLVRPATLRGAEKPISRGVAATAAS